MKSDNSIRWNNGLQAVAFRMTRREILFLNAGLKRCVCAWAQAKECGSCPSTDFFRVYPHLRPRAGKFAQGFMNYVLAVAAVVARWVEDRKAKGHRVRLDAIAIAILGFFVRVADAQIRHRHVTSPITNPKVTAARLSKKLENHRRRALRKAKAAGEGGTYTQLAERWHGFQLWMRCNLLYCRCQRASPTSFRKSYQIYIAEGQKVARKVIEEQELRMPEESALRKLVKLAIRYARRGRLPGVRTLLKGDDTSFFVWGCFLKKRLVPLTAVNQGETYEEKQ